jgi:iron only hydrogenase large subunit-like protein
MFSGVVKIADIDDYITPSQNCIKPLIDKEKELKNKSDLESGIKIPGAKFSKKIQIESSGNDFEMHIDKSEIGNFNNSNFSNQKISAEPDLIKIKDKNKKTAKVSLNDCLACNGCVTTAETLLIQAQSVDEFLKNSLNSNIDGKISVVCVSPQSILSLAEYYNLSQEETLRRLCIIMQRAGVNYLFNFNTASLLTLMQSYHEFKERIINTNSQEKKNNFIISSECPGWICYAEKKIGDWVIPHLSKLKSPQQILGHLIKKIFYEKFGKETYLTCVMPCFDKKLEATRETHKFDTFLEVDTVVSTIELLELFSKLNIDFEDKGFFEKEVPQIYVPFINLLSNIQIENNSPTQLCADDYKIFFSTLENYSSNGYSEFILNEYIKEFIVPKNIQYKIERKLGKNSDYKEILLYVDGNENPILSFCLVYGFRNIQNIIRNKGKIKYNYLEVMACPGGCINGGGQMRPKDENITARDLLKKIEEKFNDGLREEILSCKRDELGMKINNDFDVVYKYLVNEEEGYNKPNYLKQIFETEFKALDKTNTLNLKW